jgi:hypothetical protein
MPGRERAEALTVHVERGAEREDHGDRGRRHLAPRDRLVLAVAAVVEHLPAQDRMWRRERPGRHQPPVGVTR